METNKKKRKNCALACNLPVYSPRISLDMMTVKMGAELFTVSAKETATFFRLTKPSTTVMNLAGGTDDNATNPRKPHLHTQTEGLDTS